MEIIEQIISDFHGCTEIGIQFFDEHLNQVNARGPVEFTSFSFSEANFKKLSQSAEIVTPQNIRYIIFPFDERPQIKGYFAVGPYQSSCMNSKQIIFKPVHCWPHLEALLQLIIRSQLVQDSGQNPHICKSIQYIDDNYDLPITLEEVSDYVHLNMYYFSTLFKRTTGLTFNQYLNQVRIERSKELLSTSSKSVMDISLSVGFNNHNYFSSVFKKLTGTTPTAFREDALL